MLTIIQGDALEKLRELPTESVHCCVTSPPYWGLRDYSTKGQLGLEKTPEEYLAKMVEIFREVRRVLRKDGTLWLNLGDSYASNQSDCDRVSAYSPKQSTNAGLLGRGQKIPNGLKSKDLCGIPWRVAFALQADGWYLRSDIIWSKPNPMPESVTDRPTKAHEYLFLLTKSPRYFYDDEAIKEQATKTGTPGHLQGGNGERAGTREGLRGMSWEQESGRNKRSVWTVATAPYPEAHFATYPPDLIKPCILAGTSARGCCAKCGVAWERILSERDADIKDAPSDYSISFDKGSMVNVGHGIGVGVMGGGHKRQQWLDEHPKKTLGWQPTCKCCWACDEDANFRGIKEHLCDCKITKPYSTQSCTVLDPFAGSGTTGAVALELGRRAILIELNPKYVELIEQRCNVTLGLALA